MESDVRGPLCVCICWSSARYTEGRCRCVGGLFVMVCMQYEGVIFSSEMMSQMVPPDLDSSETEVPQSIAEILLLMYSVSPTPGGRKLSVILFSVLHFKF